MHESDANWRILYRGDAPSQVADEALSNRASI